MRFKSSDEFIKHLISIDKDLCIDIEGWSEPMEEGLTISHKAYEKHQEAIDRLRDALDSKMDDAYCAHFIMEGMSGFSIQPYLNESGELCCYVSYAIGLMKQDPSPIEQQIFTPDLGDILFEGLDLREDDRDILQSYLSIDIDAYYDDSVFVRCLAQATLDSDLKKHLSKYETQLMETHTPVIGRKLKSLVKKTIEDYKTSCSINAQESISIAIKMDNASLIEDLHQNGSLEISMTKAMHAQELNAWFKDENFYEI